MKTPVAALFLPLVLIAGGPVFAQPMTPGNAAPAGRVSAATPAAPAGSADGDGDGDRAWAAVVALRTATAGPSAPSAAAPASRAAAVGATVLPATSGPTPSAAVGATATAAGPVATSGPAGGAGVAPPAPGAPGAAVSVSVPFAPSAATLTEARARAVARAQSSRQTAAAARDFYTRFPAHAQAAAARKWEALAGLAGITNDQAHEAAALKTAGDFRVNQAHPIADRFEVAHAVERFHVGRKIGGRHWLSAPFESEGLADRLRMEFGHLPEVYGNYLAIAEHTQCDHSRDLSRRILQMPAPAHVKAAAQRVFERANLMGKPLDFPLTTTAGKATRLSSLAGATAGARTVVVFWDGPRAPAGPAGLHPYVKNAPPNTQWVYISLGAWTRPPSIRDGNGSAIGVGHGKQAPPAIRANAAPPGTYCVEPLGLRSPLVAQLKLSQLPFVCVLDEKRQLNAFGRVDELPALLAGINRLVEQ